MTIVLALCADLVFGLGVALQQRAALEVPEEHALRPGLLVRLAQRPLWLAGLGCEIGGFALHAAALARGSLVLVQPILTLDLVFTLAIGAAWTHTRLTRRDWFGVACTILGVSAFLVAAAWALRTRGVGRAARFAVAAGVANAFMAVLTKAFADKLGDGIGATFSSWEPYAVVAAGLLSMLLIQTAYQAGHPTVVLPTINVVDPLVSSLIGVTLFGEAISYGDGRGIGVGAAIAVMVAGLIVLGRNPLVTGGEHAVAEVVR